MSADLKMELAQYLRNFITERRLSLFREVLTHRTRHVRLVLERVADPGDVAAVMRSCECYGIQNLDFMSRDEFRVTRGVAMGSAKWLDFRHHQEDEDQLFDQLAGDGYRIIALVPDETAVPIHNIDLDQKIALVIGGRGVSDKTLARASVRTRIPTQGFTRDFTVSVNAGLCLSSLSTRLHASPLSWRLSDPEKLELELAWLVKMPKSIQTLGKQFMEERGYSTQFMYEQLPEPVVRHLL